MLLDNDTEALKIKIAADKSSEIKQLIEDSKELALRSNNGYKNSSMFFWEVLRTATSPKRVKID